MKTGYMKFILVCWLILVAGIATTLALIIFPIYFFLAFLFLVVPTILYFECRDTP